MLKTLALGIAFVIGFFAAISFTSDEELLAAAESQGYMAGLTDGAREQALTGGCNWRSQFREMPKQGAM